MKGFPAVSTNTKIAESPKRRPCPIGIAILMKSETGSSESVFPKALNSTLNDRKWSAETALRTKAEEMKLYESPSGEKHQVERTP